MKYILFRKADGRVIGSGSAPDGTVGTSLDDAAQAALVVDQIPDHLDAVKVVGGALVAASEADFAEEKAQVKKWETVMALNGALSASDWTQVPDSPADTGKWRKYRAEIRHLKAQIKSGAVPLATPWPQKPQ